MEFKDNPRVQEVIDRIEKYGTSSTTSTIYIKREQNSDGTIKHTEYTQEEYENLSRQIQPMDLPIDRSFDWIRLKLQATQLGTHSHNYEFTGFYEWLTLPVFTGNDVFAIGHDATITFDNSSAFGQFNTTYFPGGDMDNPVEDWQFYDSSDTGHCDTDVNGVGFKFNLLENGRSGVPADTKYMGLIDVMGTVLQSSGNLQISYAHSQLALDYNVEDAINFLANGALEFKIKGTYDIVKTGDRVVVQ